MLRRGRRRTDPWLGTDSMLVVGLRTIQSPLVYSHSVLWAVHDTGGELEPAWIDPTLPLGAMPDPSVPEQLSYAALSPGQRTQYLDFLAEVVDKQPLSAPSWCGMLYVAGLERRLYVDHQHQADPGELPLVVERLSAVLPIIEDEADRRAVLTLLLLASIGLVPTDRRSPGPPDLPDEVEAAVPGAVEMVAAWHKSHGRNLPVPFQTQVLRLRSSDAGAAELRACPGEFVALLEQRDRAQPPLTDALELEQRELLIEARSPSFKLPITLGVSAITRPSAAALISELAARASSIGVDLARFARWKELHPDSDDSVARQLLLPPSLGGQDPTAAPELIEQLRTMAEAGEARPMTQLLTDWPLGQPRDVAEYEDIVRVAERAGFGLVPDSRHGDPIDLTASVLAFASSDIGAPSATTLWHLELLRASWALIQADGVVATAELWRLEDRLVAQEDLTSGSRQRLLATYEWLRQTNPTLPSQRWAEPVSPEARQALARFLVALACADGDVAREERDVLELTFAAAGIETARVDALLTDLTGGRAHVSPDPRVLPAAVNRTHSAPPERAAPVPADDAELAPPNPRTPEPSSEPASVLPAELRDFLRDLIAVAITEESTARAMARERGLFWGDASERINDAALDRTGELAIVEADGMIDVQIAIAERLVS